MKIKEQQKKKKEKQTRKKERNVEEGGGICYEGKKNTKMQRRMKFTYK